MNHRFQTNSKINTQVDKILMSTSYSSFQEYVEGRINKDIEWLKKNPNKKFV